MTDSVAHLVDERLVRPLVASGVGGSAAVVVLDLPPWYVPALLGAVFVYRGADVLARAYDFRRAVTGLAHGCLCLVTGGGLVVAYDPPLWAAAVVFGCGGWFLVDSVQVLRHEGLSLAAWESHDVSPAAARRRVQGTLWERPMDREALAKACDLDPAVLDRAVETLLDDDDLVRDGDRLRATSPPPDSTAGLYDLVTGLPRRLARPLTIEFGSEP